ncbi:MAG: 3-isopropylmalate dehydrogenase [candidate division CPR1 bacterium GW2011_GWA2_42_17]|uniref:3-isopropylmalate dehydrogenase n=1 Tax=candidate division CPR1 bacterium GW2011_GWA2_42_17 TaxID=1618341 RepID=A0A0G1BBQ2_9BACT|nr:MAG: 3-isopropylmalate dehydrogenase [candidate division CPR1 bacterium GW2011_GWA2_42_17]
MKNYNLAVIPGDGIGPEVIQEGLKVLDAACAKHNFKINKTTFDFGGKRYLKTKQTLTDSDINELKKFDAIYLGAIGHPDVKPGILERGVLLKLRFDLDLYINLRPVKLYENVETPLRNKKPSDIDYVVIRENTGGLYTGVGEVKEKGTPREVAVQHMIYSRHQVERALRYAFEYTQKRHAQTPFKGLSKEDLDQKYIGKLTLCGKTNVLTYVFDLWERTFHELAKTYTNIKIDYVHVDAMCIYMIEAPERFDTIVTENMFGDIITDLAATTQGGMGIAPSGNINPESVSMFEPVHGTAPQFAGKNIINPIACILSAQMMLNYLGEQKAAANIESSVKQVLKKMKSMTAGQMGYSTKEVGDMVVKHL